MTIAASSDAAAATVGGVGSQSIPRSAAIHTNNSSHAAGSGGRGSGSHRHRGHGGRGYGGWGATNLVPAGVDLALQLVTQAPHLVEDLPERGRVQGADGPGRRVELCEQITAPLGDDDALRWHGGWGCRRRCRHRWWRDVGRIGLSRRPPDVAETDAHDEGRNHGQEERQAATLRSS